MDIPTATTLATMTWPYILAFLQKSAEKAGEQAGEEATVGIAGLARRLWAKMKSHSDAKESMTALEAAITTNSPVSAQTQASVVNLMARELAADPDLRDAIRLTLQSTTTVADSSRQVVNVSGSDNNTTQIAGSNNSVSNG
jgi:hypothetical protein